MPSSVLERERIENSLAVQWLGHHAFTAGGLGSIPGGELRSYNPYGWQKKKSQKGHTDRITRSHDLVKAGQWSLGGNSLFRAIHIFLASTLSLNKRASMQGHSTVSSVPYMTQVSMLLIRFDRKLNKPNSLVLASIEGKLRQFNEASVQLTCWVKERISARYPDSHLQRKRAGHSLSFCSLYNSFVLFSF